MYYIDEKSNRLTFYEQKDYLLFGFIRAVKRKPLVIMIDDQYENVVGYKTKNKMREYLAQNYSTVEIQNTKILK